MLAEGGREPVQSDEAPHAGANEESAAEEAGATGLFSVEAAVKAALESSVEIRIEKLNLLSAAAAAREARRASGPVVKLQTSGSAMTNPQEGVTIHRGAFGYVPTFQSQPPVALPERDYVLLEDSQSTYFRITATLTQPLFTWGKLREAAAAAELGFDIAGGEYHLKEKSVELQTRRAYFAALLSENIEGILAQAVLISDAILNDKEKAFEEGVITRQTVLEAAVRKAALTSQHAQAREAGATARLTLSLLTEIEPEDIVLAGSFRDAPMNTGEAELVNAAFGTSGERAVLLNRIDQAGALLDIEEASRPLLPDLSLNLSVDLTGQKIPVIGSNWTDSWDTNVIVTLGTQTTLFDSGASKSSIEQAKTSLRKARESLRGLELNTKIRVRTLVETVHSAWADLSHAAARLDLALEIERNALVSFENELITRSELQTLQLSLLAAQLEYEFALFAYESALIELETLVGERSTVF